ncbi:MAG: hypothetical protein EXS13_05595 [Planctomycetes bacterium]|nr:hypothetical protein [Planctomycetota bacterium]
MSPQTDPPKANETDEEVDAALAQPTGRKRRRRNERNAAAYDDDVCELLRSIDQWRQKSGRSFPAWSEVLGLLKNLGWRKISPAVEPIAAPPPVEPMVSAPNH